MLRRASLVHILVLAAVSACSSLPRQGPMKADIVADTTNMPDIAMIEMTGAVVAVLESSLPPTLQGAVGDYRPPREQRIGVGDGVQITLWEAAAGGLFSSPVVDRSSPGTRSAVIPEQIVARDGAITVPFGGRVEVAGRTPPEVEGVIVQRLADKAIDPQALVTVVHNISNTVSLIRDGGAAARVPLSVRGDRLLEVLAGSGGGGQLGHNDTSVQITRDGRTMSVALSAVMADPRQNIYLRPDDVVTLLRDPQTFTSSGAVAHNGLIPFDVPALSLGQAVAKAGGLIDERADPTAVYVVRFEDPAIARRFSQADGVPVLANGVPSIYHVNLRNPSSLFLAQRFPMRNRDILYVANANYSDLQKVLNMVNLLLSPALTAASVKTLAK